MATETTTIVIMGASGDLTGRKLLPALFHLSCKGRLPAEFNVVGFARSPLSDEEFRRRMWHGVTEFGGLGSRGDEWARFEKRVHFARGDLSVADDVSRLRQRLEEIEGAASSVNRLFFLSIAPQLYEPAIENLGLSGLAAEDRGWRRVVIEKPFGWDPRLGRGPEQGGARGIRREPGVPNRPLPWQGDRAKPARVQVRQRHL